MLSTNKLVQGIGVNDADYSVTKYTLVNGTRRQTWRCPYYEKWSSMLKRCYSNSTLTHGPSYHGCSVCEDWLRFSTFKTWMEAQDWEGKQLDKDLLVRGNKVYSPENCIFVSQQINTFVIESNAIRGEYPIGASWDKKYEKFKSQIKNPFTGKRQHLGYYNTPMAAHDEWLKYKHMFARLLAKEESDVRVSQAIINRYIDYDLH